MTGLLLSALTVTDMSAVGLSKDQLCSLVVREESEGARRQCSLLSRYRGCSLEAEEGRSDNIAE